MYNFTKTHLNIFLYHPNNAEWEFFFFRQWILHMIETWQITYQDIINVGNAINTSNSTMRSIFHFILFIYFIWYLDNHMHIWGDKEFGIVGYSFITILPLKAKGSHNNSTFLLTHGRGSGFFFSFFFLFWVVGESGKGPCIFKRHLLIKKERKKKGWIILWN